MVVQGGQRIELIGEPLTFQNNILTLSPGPDQEGPYAISPAPAQFPGGQTMTPLNGGQARIFSRAPQNGAGGRLELRTIAAGRTISQPAQQGQTFLVLDLSGKELRRVTMGNQSQTVQLAPSGFGVVNPPGGGGGQTPAGAAMLVITNNTSSRVQVFWKNSNGPDFPFGFIEPGAIFRRQTQMSHQWEIRNPTNGQVIQSITVTQQNQNVNVGTGTSPAPAVTFNATGSWRDTTGTYQISFRMTATGVEMKAANGVTTPFVSTGTPNVYAMANNPQVVLRFTGTDNGVLTQGNSTANLVRIKSPTPPATVTVPQLVGLTQQNAQQLLQGLGLRAKAQAGLVAPTAPQNGTIYQQQTPAGTGVAPNSEITFFYYKPASPMPAGNEFDPTGNWQLAASNYKFSIRKTAAGLDWVAPEGAVFKFVKSGQANTYQSSTNAQVTIQFTSKDAANYTNSGQVGAITRQAAQPMPTNVPAPDLRGLTLQAAQQKLQAAGLKAKGTLGIEAPDASQNGFVYEQTPNPATSVAPNSEVAFSYYKPARPKVPQLAGLTQQAATQQLQQIGATPKGSAGDPAPNASLNGKVYQQNPPQGTAIAPNTEVTFLFYKPALSKVPSLAGLTQQVAGQRLQQAGLRLKAVAGDVASTASQNGLIYQQNPKADAMVEPNTEVTFFYYKPAPVTQAVPNLANQLKFHAEDEVTKAGFQPRSKPGRTTTDVKQIGLVYSQTPQAGAQAGRNSEITFEYYTKQTQPGDQIKVPWVIHMTRWDAEMRLLNFGLIPEAVDVGPAPEPAKFGYINPWKKGSNFATTDGQSPVGDTVVAAGSKVRFEYFSPSPNIGPYDANSPNPIPDMIPYVNNDGSLDIVWTRKDGKTFYSRYTGNNWQQADHFPIPNALRYLAGMTKDEAGNSYIATMRQEFVAKADWDNYRPDVPVAHLLKVPAGGRSAQFVVNLNQKSHTKHAITNPLNTDSAAFTDGRMAYGKGTLLLSYGMNNAGNHSSTNMQGFTTDGSPVYGDGGGQHPYETRVFFDGQNFVMAKTFEAGAMFRKVDFEGSGLKASKPILVFRNDGANQTPQRQSFMRLGGVANTNNGYLLVTSYAPNSSGLGNYYPTEHVPDTGAKLYAVMVPKNFESTKPFEWKKDPGRWTVPADQARFPNKAFSNPPGGSSHVRPKLIDLKNGRYMVLCEERRSGGSQFVATVAFVIDQNGNVQAGPKSLPNARLHTNNDGFLMPNGNVGWVSGDAANNRINLYQIDQQLNVQSVGLSLP